MSDRSFSDGEVLEADFFRVSDEGIDIAISRVQDRYELQPDLTEWLLYHSTQHTGEVVDATAHILTTLQEADPDLGITQRDVQLGRLIGAWHDVIQGSDITEVDEGFLVRKFRRGDNESQSLFELLAFMSAHRGVFVPRDREVAEQGIMGTITEVDMAIGRLYQPGAGDTEASIVARAVSLADLTATPGIRGAEEFLREGRVNFVERYPALTDPVKASALIRNHGPMLVHHARHWLEMQRVHAVNRKQDFSREIADLSGDAQDAMHGLFDKFDESIEGASATAEMGAKYNPADVLGYILQDTAPKK